MRYLWLILVVGCGPSFAVRPMTEEELRLLPDHSGISAEQAASIIRSNGETLKDLQSYTVSYLKSPKGSGAFDGAIIIRWPDAMRIKGFRGAGTTFIDMKVDEGGATLYLVNDAKVILAKPDQPIPMGEESTGHSMTARQLVNGLAATYAVDPAGLERVGPDWVMRTDGAERVYDGRTLFLKKAIEKDKDGRVILTATYQEHRMANGVWFPWLIDVEDGEGRFRTKVMLKNPEINLGLVPGAFEMYYDEEEVEIIRKE